MTWTKMQHWATGLSVSTMIVLGAAVALVLVVALIAWFKIQGKDLSYKIRALIMLGTLMATSVQASGMWRFFGQTMHLTGVFKVMMFPFLELLLLAFGLQARRKATDAEPFGTYALMVWVLAVSSGAMSATDASGTTEGLFRVLVAVIVSLLWTLELFDEWRRAKKAKAEETGETPETVRWRFSLKDLGVKFGFADAADTSIVGRDANRRMDRYMRASDQVTALNEDARGWMANRRRQQAAKAKGKLLRHARLHADPTTLMAKLGASAIDEALDRLGITAAEAEQAAAEEAAAELAAVKAEAAEQVSEAQRQAAEQLKTERQAAETRYEELAQVVVQVRAELAERADREVELERLVTELRQEVHEQSLARQAAESTLEGERALWNRASDQHEQEVEALRARQVRLETRLDANRAPATPRRRKGDGSETGPQLSKDEVLEMILKVTRPKDGDAEQGAPEAPGAGAPNAEAARVAGAPEAFGAAGNDDKSTTEHAGAEVAPNGRRDSRKTLFEAAVEERISAGDLRAFSEDAEVRNALAYEVNDSLDSPIASRGTVRRYLAQYLSTRTEQGAPDASGAGAPDAVAVIPAQHGAPELSSVNGKERRN